MVKRNLKEFRDRILKLDGYRCQNLDCIHSEEWGLSVHHIKYRSQGGDESDENGITFCNSCDLKAHRGHIDEIGNRIIPHRFVLTALEKHEGTDHDRWQETREELRVIVERLEFKI